MVGIVSDNDENKGHQNSLRLQNKFECFEYYNKLEYNLLGSYHIFIGMDQLETHKAIIDCLHKSFDCVDEEGKRHTVKGIYTPITT